MLPTPVVELIVLVVSLIWLWTLLGWLDTDNIVSLKEKFDDQNKDD